MAKYIITEEKLLELLKDSLILDSLRASGVDNWTWYSDSFRDDEDKPIDFDERAAEELNIECTARISITKAV